MNKKILGGVTLAIFSGLLFSAVIEFLPNNITRTSTSASAKTKVRYYQNIKNATYMVRNKKKPLFTATVRSTIKLALNSAPMVLTSLVTMLHTLQSTAKSLFTTSLKRILVILAGFGTAG